MIIVALAIVFTLVGFSVGEVLHAMKLQPRDTRGRFVAKRRRR